MESYDEWYYSTLLELLKKKEREKTDTRYEQIELELPLEEKQDNITENDKPKNTEERGVIIIDI